MTSLLLAALIAAQCVTGTLSQYSPAATDRVIANRSIPGRTAYTLPANWREYDVLLAVESCDRLGETGVVYWQGHSGTYIVMDCSGHASTSAWMRRNNIIAEVDANTAQRWHSVGRGMMGAWMCITRTNTRTPVKK